MLKSQGLNTISQIYILISKDFRIEFRQRVLLSTLLLFVASACFSLYQVFFAARARVNPLVWIGLFWVLVLFSSFQAVSRTFNKEMDRLFWYYYFRVKPDVLILSKLLYHFLILNFIAWMALFFLSVFFKNPIPDFGLFALTVELACLGLASGLTLVSALSAKAGKNAGLLPVLGFPLILPTLLLVIKLSVNALDQLGWDLARPHIFSLLALDTIMVALSFMLFPYLWRQ
jgi:heme exporter protein B